MGIIKKAEEALTGFNDGLSSNQTSNKSSNHGPHSSKIANKLDPRVDSDKDNRARHEAIGGAAGPHNSELANKVDPQVDNNRDNRGLRSNLPTTTQYGSTAHPNTAGPHSSNLANKIDPRVDSDRSDIPAGSYNTGNFQQSTTGRPNAETMNRQRVGSDMVDPRMHSDLENRDYMTTTSSNPELGSSTDHGGNIGSSPSTIESNQPQAPTTSDGSYRPVGTDATHGGYSQIPAGSSYNNPRSQATTGSHDSNLANKLDPRVDSRETSQRTFN